MFRFLNLFILLVALYIPAKAEEPGKTNGYLSTSFIGTWEGELKIVSAPKFFTNNPKTLSYRIEVSKDKTILFIKGDNNDWGKGLSGPHVLSNAQVVTSLINSQEGFIEYYAVSLIRIAENEAQAYILRTVNNYGISPDNDTHHFSMYSEGLVKKTHNKALKVDAAKRRGAI